MYDYTSLTVALAEPAAVTHLKVEEREDPRELLCRLGEFVRLERLFLRCGLPDGIPTRTEMPPSLVALEIMVKELAPELDAVCQRFEQLESLEVWGSHLSYGVVPRTIGRMARLRELQLATCGILDLPSEVTALGALTTLKILVCPFRELPLAITGIPNLVNLEIRAELNGLPDELGAMTSLRTLNLQGCLNKGLAGSTSPFVRPIPEVLGRLVGLETLILSRCGVNDSLEVLHGLTRLQRLDLGWGRLADLSVLAPFLALEELSLRSCHRAIDLSPLGRLPSLRKLDASRNPYLEDVSGIAACRSLVELDITGCGALASLQPILEHPTLEVLVASDEILARWAQRDRLQAIPPIEELLHALGSDDRARVIRALELLIACCELNSTERGTAAFALFGVEDQNVLVDVPVLDSALARFGRDIPSDLLLGVVRMGLVSIAQNLRAVLTAIELLIERRDGVRQEEVVRIFRAACRTYDSGHRAWADTVHDHLIDKLFPRLLPGPLAVLLEGCDTEALSSASGDAMDALFPAALGQLSDLDPPTRDRLIDLFCSYAATMLDYEHVELVERLLREILGRNPGAGARIMERLGAVTEKARLQKEILEADNARTVSALLRRIRDPGDPLTFAQADAVFEFQRRVVAHASALPSEQTRWVLQASWEAGNRSWDWTRLLLFRIERDPDDARSQIEGWLASHPEDRKVVRDQIMLAKRIRLRSSGDDRVVEALRAMEARLTGEDLDELRVRELSELLLAFAKGHDDLDRDAAVAVLRRIGAQERPIPTTSVHFSYLQMRFEALVHGVLGDRDGQVPKVRAFLEAFVDSLPRVAWGRQAIETLGADGVAAAQLTGDGEIARLVFGHLVPNPVEKDRLAFNLACYHASRGERDQALRWIRRALVLGKAPDQFRRDPDFAGLQADPEFVSVLAEA